MQSGCRSIRRRSVQTGQATSPLSLQRRTPPLEASRIGESQRGFGIAVQGPVALVHEMVMVVTEPGEVIGRRGTASSPVNDVVNLVNRTVASGVSAHAAIAREDVATQFGRDRPH